MEEMRKRRSAFFEKVRKDKRFEELVKRRNINIDLKDEKTETSSDSVDEWMTMMIESGNFDLLEMDFFNNCQLDYFFSIHEELENEEMEWAINNQYSVVCFSCQKSPFTLNVLASEKTQVICGSCGFNFVVDFILLPEQFYDRLTQLVNGHSLNCTNLIKFELRQGAFRPDNVTAVCNNCGYFQAFF